MEATHSMGRSEEDVPEGLNLPKSNEISGERGIPEEEMQRAHLYGD